jgi:hypothetical protein
VSRPTDEFIESAAARLAQLLEADERRWFAVATYLESRAFEDGLIYVRSMTIPKSGLVLFYRSCATLRDALFQ